ncbi:8698_t:CDS:2, partial [Diversispora eburnea]
MEYEERDLKDGVFPALVIKGQGRPGIKRYLKNVKKGKVAIDYWNDISSVSLDGKFGGSSAEATRELEERINERTIGVKPLKLFTKIIQLWCPPNGLVLDPFAGTGTTGEAVLKLNQTEKSNRSFILIEQGNPKNGDTFARSLLVPRLKSAIT